MKKCIALLLVLGLLLCGCGGESAPETTAAPTTQAPTTVPVTDEPTEVPTTVPETQAPTEPPVLTNPLTGEILEEGQDTRIFACSINNVPAGLPMYGVSKADIFFEMYINDYCTRGLALFSDVSSVTSIGSIRSLRYNFTDLCQIYDAVVVHAGGSNQVLQDLYGSSVTNISVESELADYYFRDRSRQDQGYASEHCLFVKGAPMLAYAQQKNIRTTRDPQWNYGLEFTEDGTPADGENANVINISLKHDSIVKSTVMQYDAAQGKYLFNQYGSPMRDSSEDEWIYFENVIVMMCNVYNDEVYHVADLNGSGEGWFACGGKIIPIKWFRENAGDPITFTHADGTPLQLGVGNSYIAIAPMASTVTFE